MNKNLVILSISLFFFELPAQILNVERERQTVNDSISRWLGNVNLNFDIEQRELSILNFSNVNNLTYYGLKHQYLFISTISLAQASGTVVESNGYAHLRLNFWSRKLLSWELFSQIQYDKTRGLERRLLTGNGLRFSTVNSSKTLLHLGLSTMYEVENWNFEGQKALTKLFKCSSYISLNQIFTDTFFANAIVYYQARWDQLLKPRVIADLHLNFILSQRTQLTLSYLLWSDTEPVVGIDKTIYSIATGLTIAF